MASALNQSSVPSPFPATKLLVCNEVNSAQVTSNFSFSFLTTLNLLLFFIALLTYVYLLPLKKYRDKNAKSKRRKIPLVSYFPVRVPSFLSGLYTLYKLGKDGPKFGEKLQSQYGNIFEMPVANQMVTVVLQPSAVQKILTSANPHHLNKPTHFYDTLLVDVIKNGLIASDHGVWSVHRKLLSKCFTYTSLQNYLPHINEHGRSLVHQFNSICSTSRDNSVSGSQVHDAVWSETFKIIIQTIMGEDVFQDDGHIKLQDAFKRLKEIVQERLKYPYLLISSIWESHPLKKEQDNLINSALGVAKLKIASKKLVLEERDRVSGSEAVVEADSNGMGIKKLRSIIEELLYCGASENEIMDEMATFTMAGHDTVAVTISFVLFHLACNPECQKLCRDEVDQLLRSVGADDESSYNLTLDDLANLKYLERCILEGIRLTPVVPLFMRILTESLEIGESLTLKSGTTVLFSPWVMHRDPENFPSPTKFDPERFLPENVKGRHLQSFLPFSTGPRNCLGYKLAIIELKTIMALLIRNFEIFTTMKPENINYFVDITLTADKELNVILKSRQIF